MLQCFVRDNTNKHATHFSLDLTGLYQLKNLKSVLAAENILTKLGFEISNENKKIALANVKKLTGLKGRWDLVSANPSVIHDVAHNKDGISILLHQLEIEFPQSSYHFVIGFVNDKDISAILELLPKNANYYFTNAHLPRALPQEQLKTMGNKIGLIGNSYDDVNEAIYNAQNNAAKKDVIIVCGSFFILSEVTQ